MRKTLGGIKHHWRPVYNQSASGTTSSTNLQTILDLTATKRGKVAICGGNYSWLAGEMEIEVTIDGVTNLYYHCWGSTSIIRADYHFVKSIRIRHRIYPGSGGTIRTDVAYWAI